MMRNQYPWKTFILLLFSPPFLFSQTSISGVINSYLKISAIDYCEGKLTAEGPTSAFSTGGKVLVIQMKGAAINTSNTSGYGDILDLGSAGLFEKNEIKNIVGQEVFLKYTLLNEYAVEGLVQLVSIPQYGDAVVDGTLSGLPWNGQTGGLVAFEVAGTLVLNANVSATGAGFRGGSLNVVTSDCNFLTNADGYFYGPANWRGASKGEGIAATISGKENGRGAQANGGGGGNDHNSGGGGGSNLAPGGNGGKQNPASALGCFGNFPGRGGKAIAGGNRVFLGGGGGAGHTDDTGAGSAGAGGGGIVIISAGTLTGNGFAITADGAPAQQAGGDGAGGGGGGGGILLTAGQVIGPLAVSAKGGKGGDGNNPADRCLGPGGGGSGGLVMTNQAASLTAILDGGSAGANLNPSPQCSTPSNEATAGQNGEVRVLDVLPQSDEEILAPSVQQQPEDAASCVGGIVVFEITAAGAPPAFQWQLNDGSGWSDVPDNGNFTGARSAVLTILEATGNMDGLRFRCKVDSPCMGGALSEEAVLEILLPPAPGFTFDILADNEVRFTNTTVRADTYLWDFGDGATSTDANPLHHFQQGGQQEVKLAASNACGQTSITQTLATGIFPTAAFSANITRGCAPAEVHFTNQSTGSDLTFFHWEFEGGAPATSSEANPVVVFQQPGAFGVSLTVGNSLGENTASSPGFILLQAMPQAAFSYSTDLLTVTFTNTSTGGDFYFWDFGDGQTSQEMDPLHTYTEGGVYDVTLTALNSNCGSAILQQVPVNPTAVKEGGRLLKVKIFPNPVLEKVTIELEEARGGAFFIYIYDVKGGLVAEKTALEKATQFDVSTYPAGLYLVELGNGEWKARLRFVKL